MSLRVLEHLAKLSIDFLFCLPNTEIFAMEDAYEKFFRESDDDNNGYLTVGELVKALKRGGYRGTERDIKVTFHES